jgi:predicted ATP-grasp superfamily ATP-dependent carboligase
MVSMAHVVVAAAVAVDIIIRFFEFDVTTSKLQQWFAAGN